MQGCRAQKSVYRPRNPPETVQTLRDLGTCQREPKVHQEATDYNPQRD